MSGKGSVICSSLTTQGERALRTAPIAVFRRRNEAPSYGRNTRAAGRVCPVAIHKVARRKLMALDSAESRDTIRAIPGNEWEKLTADREGQESIRVNDQYRVCFTWTDEGPADVEITDYH